MACHFQEENDLQLGLADRVMKRIGLKRQWLLSDEGQRVMFIGN